MFLNQLSQEEKIAFLELAHYVARSDGDFSKKQQNIIKTYCHEMQISDIAFNIKNFKLKKVLKKFQSKKSQKIALLEILALIYSDFFLHKEEEKIIKKMLKVFDIDNKLFYIYAEWTKSILSLAQQGELLLEL